MHSVVIDSVNGSMAYDAKGNAYTIIGNNHVLPGSAQFTDGRYIYGHATRRKSAGVLPMISSGYLWLNDKLEVCLLNKSLSSIQVLAQSDKYWKLVSKDDYAYVILIDGTVIDLVTGKRSKQDVYLLGHATDFCISDDNTLLMLDTNSYDELTVYENFQEIEHIKLPYNTGDSYTYFEQFTNSEYFRVHSDKSIYYTKRIYDFSMSDDIGTTTESYYSTYDDIFYSKTLQSWGETYDVSVINVETEPPSSGCTELVKYTIIGEDKDKCTVIDKLFHYSGYGTEMNDKYQADWKAWYDENNIPLDGWYGPRKSYNDQAISYMNGDVLHTDYYHYHRCDSSSARNNGSGSMRYLDVYIAIIKTYTGWTEQRIIKNGSLEYHQDFGNGNVADLTCNEYFWPETQFFDGETLKVLDGKFNYVYKIKARNEKDNKYLMNRYWWNPEYKHCLTFNHVKVDGDKLSNYGYCNYNFGYIRNLSRIKSNLKSL